MRYLKRFLFGIILLSSFGSAFAGYDSTQDVFDQVIYVLVPTLIVYLFKSEEKDLNVSNSNSANEEGQEDITLYKSIKIRRAFDDFLFLLSLFVLPIIVFHINQPILWISILLGVTAGVVFIMITYNYIYFHIEDDVFFTYAKFIPPVIELCHVFSDICFLFYTRSIPVENFGDYKNVFIYLHAVTGFLGTIFMFYVIIFRALFNLFYICTQSRKLIDIASKYHFHLYTVHAVTEF
jgi:hypothetical protein